MTPSEAVIQAAENHEFRTFQRVTIAAPSLVDAVVAICWCGKPTPPFLSEKFAREAHERHQSRMALMRSFGHWEM